MPDPLPTSVLVDAVLALPEWLLLGAALGLGASVTVGVLFFVGERFFPSDQQQSGDQWSGESRRRAEIREYLRLIDEPFAEDHFVEGQEVEFFLPKRGVAITFDPRAFYRIERSPTTAVLVEHELPGIHIGARLPFETPDIEFDTDDEETAAAPEADPTRAAFAVLGLPETASEREVKRAYRQKVKEVHPDQGGDEEDFHRVRDAYATAKDHAS